MNQTPFRALSHIFSTCWGFATPRDIQHLLFTRAGKRNPRLQEMTQTGPMTWDRTHKAEVQAAFERATRKTPALVARLHRLRDWIAAQNRAALDSMTQDEARAALFALESGCLKWHERLPVGIEPQRAADVTGISFCQSWWEGSALRSVSYYPNAKPRRSYQVAKAI